MVLQLLQKHHRVSSWAFRSSSAHRRQRALLRQQQHCGRRRAIAPRAAAFGSGISQNGSLGSSNRVDDTSRRATMMRLLSTTGTGDDDASAATAASSSGISDNNDNDDDSNNFDVIVVGGGHAGCEAAAASARVGARTALITQRLDTVGELSCNPSVGGIGKGHLVREVDALGGLMGRIADEAGIHYRVLNQRKGPAVRGPRAQMDRDLYKTVMQATLANYGPNLHFIQASVQDFLLDEKKPTSFGTATATSAASSSNTAAEQRGLLGMKEENGQEDIISASMLRDEGEERARIRGVLVETTTTSSDGSTKTHRREIYGRSVVVTTGTFLRGVLMLGRDRYAGGRHLRDSEKVEPPSTGLASTLERFEFPLGRLKTGTPARIDGRTVDWDACTRQPTEMPPMAQPFCHVSQYQHKPPPRLAEGAGSIIDCFLTETNDATHELVMKYEHTLPVYDGGLDGAGNGPRYCPSIYKKVQRFPHRDKHNCFLEPEGLNTDIVYPNGMSGPYPPEIQEKILRTMRGLGAVEIVRPGYDVEYDFVNPQRSLTHALETKPIAGLYLAGQICGTTGYEEAAAQGIVAGANAAIATIMTTADGDKKPAHKPFLLGRDEAYIGVLIDDLVTRGTLEPYRMFTSRAEYRISLRADNADIRLTRKGMEYGLVNDPERIAGLLAREQEIHRRIDALRSFSLKVSDWAERSGDTGGNQKNNIMGGDKKQKHGERKTAEQVLIMPHVTLKNVEDIMIRVQQEQREQQKQQQEQEQQEQEQNVDDVELNGMKQEEPEQQQEEEPTLFTPSPGYVYDTVEASVKYQQYVKRQVKDMESWRKAQGLRIPPDVIYDGERLPTLSGEELEKLNAARPTTFAEASQISGMTPHSLVYLYHHVQGRYNNNNRRRRRESDGSSTGGITTAKTTTTTSTTKSKAPSAVTREQQEQQQQVSTAI